MLHNCREVLCVCAVVYHNINNINNNNNSSIYYIYCSNVIEYVERNTTRQPNNYSLHTNTHTHTHTQAERSGGGDFRSYGVL